MPILEVLMRPLVYPKKRYVHKKLFSIQYVWFQLRNFDMLLVGFLYLVLAYQAL